MGKTKEQLRKIRFFEEQKYCGPDSMITINRAFAERIVKLLKEVPEGTMEAAQLNILITKSRDRIKVESSGVDNRPIIS